MKPLKNKVIIPVILLLSSSVFANQAQVVDVKVTNNPDSFRFDVTLRHDDAGWDHYADGWEVLSPAGDILGERLLAHPHVSEQPFTRSLSGVKIPPGVSTVSIRAHDSVHGYNEETFKLSLPGR